ncbi:U32 family peptidase [Ectobacillus funiculus]|uniref:U32 family peptidase n=1 Tax=Ectobacillus funiculus TaxID=137993 RepID=UPI003979D8B6
MLDQLKLVAPVRSKFMLQEMLEAGVDEIYVGVRHPLLQQLSFDNRFQTVAGYPAHFENWESLQEVIDLAKRKSVQVIFMANASYIPRELEQLYIGHVAQAVELGVDFVTVSSFQTLELLKGFQKRVAFISGSTIAPVNKYAVRMLREKGIARITVGHSTTLEEIKRWKQEGLEMMITGNFGTGSVPAACRLWESPNNAEIGEGIRSGYRVEFPDGSIVSQMTLLDSATDCSLCNLEELVEAGVRAIKFIGREAPNPVSLSLVVDVFRQWKELGLENVSIAGKKEIMEQEQLMWVMKWVPRFCEKCRCTYLPTRTNQMYV